MYRETVYYPWRNGVFVSNRKFSAHGRTYRVDAMTRPARAYGSARARWAVAGQTVAVETALGAVVALAAPTVLTVLVVAGYLVLVALTLWAGAALAPAPRQLWVHCQGVPTMIFTSTDELEFGKVCRALLKAIESNLDLAA
jgi:hypothetical protein